MPPSNPFLRLVAIRLAVIAVVLYAVRALAPDPASTTASFHAASGVAAVASDHCAPRAGDPASEADTLLRDMLLHD
jgi:hypothetical protein